MSSEQRLGVSRQAEHADGCEVYTVRNGICSCELSPLYTLASAAGRIVWHLLQLGTNIHGEREQALIDAHGKWLERIT